jgi:hypothetical protein
MGSTAWSRWFRRRVREAIADIQWQPAPDGALSDGALTPELGKEV